MAAFIYLLCAATALACFGFLMRSWLRTRAPLLFWSSLCFAGLTLNNVVLVVDKVLLPDVNLVTVRLVIALTSLLLLLGGLIWEDR